MVQDDIDQKKITAQFRLAAAAALIVLVGGAIFYHYTEGLSWVNAFYFCTITLTTIGYGDITPHTDAGKIFTIFYVFVGIAIIAAFAQLLLKRNMVHRESRLKKRER